MMSNGRKRRREETEAESSDADHSLSLEQNLTFTDTLAALQIMRAQFPQIDKVATLPFILQSQLYSSVKDRTQVDRELESLRREKVVRIFKLNTGQDDHGIMFLDDYLKQIENVVKRMEERKKVDLVVFKWFKVHVIETKLEPCIEHEELCSLLSLGGKVKDEHISLLINAGLLTRQLIDPSRYWFAIPNIGLILKGLSQGRKELLSLLNRRRYKEMMLAPLEKKRLQFSPLDMRFHLRDLIGSGHLKTDHTPTGIVVRVLKEFLNEEQNKTCLNAMYVQINIECRMKFASMSVIWMPTAKQYPQQALPKAQASPRNKGDLPWDCCSYKNDDIYERHNSMHQHYQKIG